jgi:anti-sigma B factor antagonist
VQLSERVVGDVVVVQVSGEITLGKGGDAALKDRIRGLIDRGHRRLVVDLAEVTFLDSAGLGELVQAYATTKNKGGALKLARPPKRIRDLLTITKLVTVFECYDREEDAVASFAAKA